MTTRTDHQQVEALVTALGEAQSDTDRFCDLLAEDVVVVNIAGVRVAGREAMRRAMQAALRTDLGDVRTDVEVLDIAFPAADLAVVSAVKHVDDRRDGDRGSPMSGAYTIVAVRRGDDWEAALLQTTPRAAA